MDAIGPNAEQIRYWNETAGPKWVALAEAIDGVLAPVAAALFSRAASAPGEHVLDVGCGAGATTLEIARRVGPTGSATGVDISGPLLERARVRAAGADPVARFELADAQTHVFAEARFDLVFSRFGVMFFADPQAAFMNLGHALRPGGRVCFVCWQPLARNPWMLVPLGAAARHIALPEPPPPDAPGPFSFGDSERVRGILAGAGLRDVALEGIEETLTLGRDVEETVGFVLQMGPAGAALREADPSVLPRVTTAVKEALAPFASAAGVRLPSAAWIVTARRP